MPGGGGSDGTVELTLFLLIATDGMPHSPARSLTLYALNESHARKQAKRWIDEWHETLPHIEIEAYPNGFTIGTTVLPGKVKAQLPLADDSEVRL